MMSSNSPSPTDVYVEGFLEALGCPRALSVYLLFKAGEWEQLFDIEFHPEDYNSLDDARTALSATAFLSKNRFSPVPWDKKKRALEKFKDAEQTCRETNHRILRGYYKNVATGSILSRMESKIRRTLGESFDGAELLDRCGWGPGATVLLPRRSADQPRKFSAERQITPEAYYFIKDWFPEAYPLWADFIMEIIPGNKVVTVPKNSKTDRVIAIEPGLNSWFQKGCGSMIRSLLRKAGLDLNTQVPNQERSRIGAKFNNLATVDFSAASDTIASALVEQLLPREWFLVLDTFRSRFGQIDDELVYYAKFSSMGNGYTFELESLIFWSLAHAVCEHLGLDGQSISVFGDDVILPAAAFSLFREVAQDLGFSVNMSKTYVDGMFRESCGEFHWGGARIKPIFLKEALSDVQQITLAANSVRRLSHRWLNGLGCDSRFESIWQRLVDLLGSDYPRISEGYGDVGVIENFDHPTVSAKRAPFPIEGWSVRCWATVISQKEINSRGLLLFRLKSIGCTDLQSGNGIPTSQVRVARRRLLIPRWFDLGPWY